MSLSAKDRLALVNVKVERAKQHIVNLDAAIGWFLASEPYSVVKQVDPQSGKFSYQIDGIRAVPLIIPAIFGDAIQNLRSALDHLAIQLLMAKLGVATTNEEFLFPIYGDRKKYEAAFARKEEPRVSREAWTALGALKAYKGGDGHQLWLLNRLNNIDKHRLMLAVGSASKSVNIGAMLRPMIEMDVHPDRPNRKVVVPDLFLRPADNQCPLKVGDVLATGTGLDPSAEMNANNDFRFEIAVHEPQVLERKPIIEAAQEFTDLVSGIINQFRIYLG